LKPIPQTRGPDIEIALAHFQCALQGSQLFAGNK